MTTYREGCGTHLGLLLHQASGEPPCATCLAAEDMRRLERERTPRRPSPVHDGLAPITPEQAAAHLAELTAAVTPRTGRRLRVVA